MSDHSSRKAQEVHCSGCFTHLSQITLVTKVLMSASQGQPRKVHPTLTPSKLVCTNAERTFVFYAFIYSLSFSVFPVLKELEISITFQRNRSVLLLKSTHCNLIMFCCPRKRWRLCMNFDLFIITNQELLMCSYYFTILQKIMSIHF